MKPKEFVRRLDEPRIVAAIAEAERRSSGEIRVYVSHEKPKNALVVAQDQFLTLGMQKTKLRNGVLIYFAPASKQFAIIGDSAIHEKCGDHCWQEIVARMSSYLKNEQYSDAIIEAIREVGDLLAKHFPSRGDDKDELPNALAGD